MHWPFTVESDGALFNQASVSKLTTSIENGVARQTPDGDLIALDKPTFNDTWVEMEKIYASGRARAIGVSNFSVKK